VNNMKKLVSVVVFSFATLTMVGCGTSPITPANSTPEAGVYFISASAGYNLPQVVLSDGSEVRLGTESRNTLVSVNVIDGGTLDISLKVIDVGGVFSTKAYRLPVSASEYSVASPAYPFCGLFSTRGGSDLFAISQDSVVVMSVKSWSGDDNQCSAWKREKVSGKINISTASLEIDGDRQIKKWIDQTPLECGVAQYYPPTGVQAPEQIIGMDGLGR